MTLAIQPMSLSLKPAKSPPNLPPNLRDPWWQCAAMIGLAKSNQYRHLPAAAALATEETARVEAKAASLAALTGTIDLKGKTVALVWAMPHSGRNAMPWSMPNWPCANWPLKRMASRSHSCSARGKNVNLT
jgi:hypothetical protein